jgi:hypothetical protein
MTAGLETLAKVRAVQGRPPRSGKRALGTERGGETPTHGRCSAAGKDVER